MIRYFLIIFLFFNLLYFGCANKKNVITSGKNLNVNKNESNNNIEKEKYKNKKEKKDEDFNILERDINNTEEPNICNIRLDFELNFEPIYFDYDKIDIKDKYKENLLKIFRCLKDNKEYKLLIEGHTDERGSIKYNLGLGENRAVKVRVYISSLGINPNRIATISYGKEKPVSFGKTEEDYALNRRVEFFIFK